jgi:hypothetical protein
MRLKLPSGMTYGIDRYGNKVCTGASMGRRNQFPKNRDASVKLRLQKVPLHGDYDQGGAYWGAMSGMDIYCAWGEWGMPKFEPVTIFVRAVSREEAKEYVLEFLPHAKFYR